MLPSTYIRGRPWTLLPLPAPCDYSPAEEFGEDFFYDHVAHPLIETTVRLMNTGLPIDLTKVQELEKEVDTVLFKVEATIESNSVIQDYYQWKYPSLLSAHNAEIEAKLRHAADYYKPFDPSEPTHRSYYMHLLLASDPEAYFDIIPPIDTLPTGIPKWDANSVKRLAKTNDVFRPLATKRISDDDQFAEPAAQLLAQHRADLWNKNHEYYDKLNKNTINDIVPTFNPASSDQKHDLLTGMLDHESDKLSDAFSDWQREVQRNAKYGTPIESPTPKNKYSWSREEIEKLQSITDPESPFGQLLQAFVDHSFAAIIRQNFIEAFYKYSVDGRLYGQYKLIGAKSGRYTSSNPNMLNAPSTGSIYSKPLKKCFIAPPGYVIAAIDYAALEDRVIASLTADPNKCAVFTENVDGHSLGACAYFPDEVSKEMELTGDNVADAKQFKYLVDSGNKVLKELRQRGKGITFGLSYGAHPPKVANQLKCSMDIATSIFNNYHNNLYSGITVYREEYVLPTTKQDGRIHLGMGFYIRSAKPDKDVRTLHNATCQFWSILTALAINELNYQIDQMDYQEDIQVTSTIYDSIYMIVREDTQIIKWLNDTLVPIMTKDFMTGQLVHNEANLELGTNWADLIELPNNATVDEIQSVLTKLQGDQ